MWASFTPGKFCFQKETLGFNDKHFTVYLIKDQVFFSNLITIPLSHLKYLTETPYHH